MEGHICKKCDNRWTHDNCDNRGVGIDVCPNCVNVMGFSKDRWRYLEDSFTKWVKEERKKNAR